MIQLYDSFMYLREQLFNLTLVQILGAILFLWSFLIAILLSAYWLRCALVILSAPADELTDAELDALHWNRRDNGFSKPNLSHVRLS